MVDLPSLPLQQGCDPVVAVVRVAESQLLNEIAQTCLGPTQPVTVITRAADASEPTHSINPGLSEIGVRDLPRHAAGHPTEGVVARTPML